MQKITLKKQKQSLATKQFTEKNDDPTTASNETIKKVISRFQKENLLNKSISEGLKAENFETLQFTYSQNYENMVTRED